MAEPSTAGGRSTAAPCGRAHAATVLARILDSLLPGDCAGCGSPGPVLCRDCAQLLRRPAIPAWPSPSPAGLPPPWSVASYDGVVRAALLAYKEHGVGALATALGTALGASVSAACASLPAGLSLAVVPMPSSRAATRRRGEDVVARLAAVACRQASTGGARIRLIRALRFQRAVADSAGLSAAGRRANLHEALAPRRRPGGGESTLPVLLVDDVITTGATLAAAAAVLRRCGFRPVAAATVAATRRRGPGEYASDGLRLPFQNTDAPSGDLEEPRCRSS